MARSKSVRIPDFNKAIQKIVDEYGESVTESTKKAVVKVADIAKKEVKEGSPVHEGQYVTKTGRPIKRKKKRFPGKYKKGWTVKEDTASRFRTEAIVHNRTDYQLAHLLEKGHALKRGGRTYGRVRAFSHIKLAEEHAIKNMKEAMKKIAKG